jgi:HNH endonuclease
VDDCGKPVKSRGYCFVHLYRWRKHGDPLVTTRAVSNAGLACQAEEPCDKPVSSKGLCKNHYYRSRTHGTTGPLPEATPADRLWAKVDKNGPVPDYAPHLGPCWIWTGAGSKEGYGRIWLNGGNYGTHRLSYELLVGPIPDGLVIDHLCRNPPCVNPAHLEPVTDRENLHRGVGVVAINAAKTHCPQGHEYDEQNTYHEPGGKGRQCKTCIRERQQEQAKGLGIVAHSARTHCPQGHPYDDENTYLSKTGHRACKECKRERTRAWRAAKAAAGDGAATGQGSLL